MYQNVVYSTPRFRSINFFRLIYKLSTLFVGLLILFSAVSVQAQVPKFNSDCPAGQLLADGFCQPMEYVLASQGGRVFWVSKTGNNANLGTRTQPWKTINRAAQEMLPGDAVIVRAGAVSY